MSETGSWAKALVEGRVGCRWTWRSTLRLGREGGRSTTKRALGTAGAVRSWAIGREATACAMMAGWEGCDGWLSQRVFRRKHSIQPSQRRVWNTR
eukprot:1193730-Prorocentrum_minimum.AAC.6